MFRCACAMVALLFTGFRVQAVDEEYVNACLSLFSPKIPKEECCRVNKLVESEDEKMQLDACKPNKHAEWTCQESECVMRHHGLLYEDGMINYDKFKEKTMLFLEENHNARSMVYRVNYACNEGKYEHYFPEYLCSTMKFQACVLLNSIVECPEWSPNRMCQKMSEDVRICKELLDRLEEIN